jgi:ornithine cyclodeaminase
LTQSDVGALLDAGELMWRLREAFEGYSLRRSVAARRIPVPLPAPAPEGSAAMVLVPGFVEGVPAYTVKVHAKFPGQSPAIRGLILLHDLATGAVLAVLDSGRLTAMRTGAAAALSAEVLARADAGDLAIVGAGAQGETALACLARVRRLRRVRVYDTAPGKAAAFCRRQGAAARYPIEEVSSVREALGGADLVLTATWSQSPFLSEDMLAAGTHVMTLGPDQPGKAELTIDAIRRSRFVCDDRDLAVEMGAIGGVALDGSAIHAELGEVLAGRKPGRDSPDQVTVFGSVGLAFQDLVAAWLVFEQAKQRNIRSRIDFLT